MTKHLRDEGPLPDEALRNLSYINDKDARISWLEKENVKLRKRGDKYYSIVEDLGGQMHDLRETVRWYGAFVESVKDACLLAQGVKKNAPLGGREIADRGFRKPE